MTTPQADTVTCEGMVDEKSSKNKAFKGKVKCGKAVKTTRTKLIRVEEESGAAHFENKTFHLCGTCARGWDGIPSVRKPRTPYRKEVFGVYLMDPNDPLKRDRPTDAIIEQVPLFSLPTPFVPEADRVRLMPGQTDVYEVWLAGSGGAVPMSGEYIYMNYPALIRLIEKVKDDGKWVEMSK